MAEVMACHFEISYRKTGFFVCARTVSLSLSHITQPGGHQLAHKELPHGEAHIGRNQGRCQQSNSKELRPSVHQPTGGCQQPPA